MFSIFDTARREVVPVKLRTDGKVSFYACGPTVYDSPHIGHGRSALTFDTFRRYLEWCGYEVTHVTNITDVEDKIIARAAEEGRSEAEVTEQYERVYWEAMDALGALRPTHVPHATQYIEQMQKLIGQLIDVGQAYETTDGVYFDVARLSGYGLLANQSVSDLRAGARVEIDEDKRSPIDFALWKQVDGTDQLAWDSPWGRGRPGWHTECVVMSLDLLGDGFDIHAGGLDLKFPHHENERAQAVACGYTFASYWMHHGFVEVSGEKMSKSLGNFTTLVDLLDRYDPRAYRLLVLQSHYRAPIEVIPETIGAAEVAIGRFDDFARRTASLSSVEPIAEVVAEFKAHMDNDLDTPNATAIVFDYLRKANAALDAGDLASAASAASTVKFLLPAVGLELRTGETDLDEKTQALVAGRDNARAERDFSRADELRDELTGMGWVVEDTPEGTRVHK